LKEYLLSLPPSTTEGQAAWSPPDYGAFAWLSAFQRGLSCSNNWAVEGRHTASGGALVANDPHLPYTMPSIVYLAGLECPDYRVVGASMPGIPGIVFGSNGHVVWSETSNWTDNQDLYVEQLFPGRPDHYLYQGQAIPFTVREEVFRIRDGAGYREEVLTVRETRHGVILNDVLERLPADFPLVALRRVQDAPGQPLGGMRMLYRAQTLEAAIPGINAMTAFQGHWIVGDAEGRIGYFGPANLPVRTNWEGTLPVPGWTGTYEWGELYPVGQLPRVIDPVEGLLATANQQLLPHDAFPVPINAEGDVPFRYERIVNLLDDLIARGRITASDLMEMHPDRKEIFWLRIREEVLEALAPLDVTGGKHLRKALAVLRDWDGLADPDAVGATLFNGLVAQVLHLTMQDEVPPATLHFMKEYFNLEPFVYNLISSPDNPAWDDLTTEKVETREEVLRLAFTQVTTALHDKFGRKTEDWRWGRASTLTLPHPFGQKKPLSGLLNRGPFELGGGISTVFKQQFHRTDPTSFPVHHGPVFRMVVDLGNFAESRFVLPGGQSGRPRSEHYADLLPLYLEGTGIPMPLSGQELGDNITTRITFRPR
jgi:penicillin G amidase